MSKYMSQPKFQNRIVNVLYLFLFVWKVLVDKKKHSIPNWF